MAKKETMKDYAHKGREGLRPLARKLHNIFHWVCDNAKADHDMGYYEGAFAYFDKRLDEIEESLKKIPIEHKKKKEPSDYNLFIAKARAEGKSLSEAIEEYKKNREKTQV